LRGRRRRLRRGRRRWGRGWWRDRSRLALARHRTKDIPLRTLLSRRRRWGRRRRWRRLGRTLHVHRNNRPIPAHLSGRELRRRRRRDNRLALARNRTIRAARRALGRAHRNALARVR
jgi:hypothetical protein